MPTASLDLGHASTGYETISVGEASLPSLYSPLAAEYTEYDTTSRGKGGLLVLIFSLSWRWSILVAKTCGSFAGALETGGRPRGSSSDTHS